MGPVDGSNTVLVGTASSVVKARSFKRLPPGERWTGSLLDEAQGNELTPNALEDDGGRVGIRAPVLQPHAAIPMPPLLPEFRQVRRAPLRRTDFEQFGYTDKCPGCANARAGRKQAVDHSEQCRFRMETILATTLEGLLGPPRNQGLRSLSARDIALKAKEGQPPAPPASSNYREGGSSSSGLALPPPPAPPPAPPTLEPPPLVKRCLEQETEMPEATVEQQGESKRRRDHPEVPQAAESSGSSSSSESSTDTEMGLVDVCTILHKTSEAKGRCEGCPATLDLTKWDFNKADCRNKYRKLVENSKPLLLIGSPIDSGREDKERARAVLYLAFICELYEAQVHGGWYFLRTHSHSADSWEQSTVVDFMNRFSDTFQTVTDRSLFGPNVPHGMNTLRRWWTNSGCVAQALSSLTHSSTLRQTIMSACPSNYIQTCVPLEGRTHRNVVRLCRSWIFLRLTRMKNRLRSGKQKTMSRGDHWTHVRSKLPVKRKYSICGKWIDTNKGSAEAPRYRSRLCVRRCATKGSNRSSRQHLRWKLYESYPVLRIRKTFFELKTLS